MQLLDRFDLLQSLAEVFAALAGFAALASALGSRRGTTSSQFSALMNSVARSIVMIVVCLLPLLLADYGLAGANVWRGASGGALVLSWICGFLLYKSWLRYEVDLSRDAMRPVARFVIAPVEVVIQLLLFVNVLGFSGEYASALYLTHVLAGFVVAAAAFLWFLDAVFSPRGR